MVTLYPRELILTKLKIHNFNNFTFVTSRGCSVPDYIFSPVEHLQFCKEMRTILESAGVEGNPICFLIEDNHLCQTEFLEMLNSLISSGEIPGLFKSDEMEGLFS